MLRYLARVIRALIASAFGFGGGIGMIVFIAVLVLKGPQASPLDAALKAGGVIGCCFAVILVCVLLPLDISAKLFSTKEKSNRIWELEQERDLTIEGPIKEVLNAARQALLVVPSITGVYDDIDNLVTRGSTGVSWRSGGEELEVEINPLAENKWHIRCMSRPKSRATVFDYGKNFANVEIVHAAMEKQLASKTKAS